MRKTTLLAGALTTLATTFGTTPGAMAAGAVYGGSTTDGQPIVLNADKAGKKLRSAVIAWTATCSDGQRFSRGSVLTAASASPGFAPGADDLVTTRNAKGRFAGTHDEALGNDSSVVAIKVSVEGTLVPKKASGTLSAHVSIVERATGNEQATCDTGRMRWKATRARGRVYAGTTSQGQPVVARLDLKRKRVTDLIVSWESSQCEPEGFLHIGESLRNFDVASTGVFGDSWDDTQQLADGSVHVTYSLSGRVARQAVRGKLDVDVQRMDAAGALSWSCKTGSVSWKATTG